MNLTFKNLFFVRKDKFSPERQKAHETHQLKISWVYYATMVLGFWLIAGPFTFGYTQKLMVWSDLVSGFLLILFSYFALRPYNLWAQWALVFGGIWLFIAPLIFHARVGAGLLNDYLVGTLVVSFAIIIARQPGIRLFSQPGPDVPPGWSYNPSSWPQRVPVIFLAWLGFFIARYMGAFQLEMIHTIWDPFFGDGTRQVLNSKVSESFPVSDALLGAFSYILDVLFGYAGGINRWRTMPWVVIIFGILIVPLGVVSITLIILQPVSVGHWCTLCLSSALISLLMIPFTLDEVLATVQMIRYERKQGKPFWTILWFGGAMPGGELKDKINPEKLLPHTIKESMSDLITRPWNLALIMAIGIWIMASPGIFGYQDTMADNHHLTGPIIVTFAVIVMSEIGRPARFIHILFAIWLIASPFILGSESQTATWNSVIAGAVLIPLTLPRGKVTDSHGDFDKYIR